MDRIHNFVGEFPYTNCQDAVTDLSSKIEDVCRISLAEVAIEVFDIPTSYLVVAVFFDIDVASLVGDICPNSCDMCPSKNKMKYFVMRERKFKNSIYFIKIMHPSIKSYRGGKSAYRLYL